MNRAMRSFLLALCVLVVGAISLCSPRQDTASLPLPSPPISAHQPSVSTPAPPSVSDAATNAASNRPSKGFRSPSHLSDHFEKHGAEFGAANASAYLALAQTLRDAPLSRTVVEIVRSTDGVISRFDRQSGAFLATNADGTIRTFFKPNDGEAYFRRQARRLPQNDGARP